MASEEISPEQLSYMRNIYMQEYEAVVSNINNYSLVANTVERNIEFISSLEKIKDKSMLLSLEAGTYIEVRPKNTDTVFTYVGFGYMIEKSREEAKKFLENSKKKTDDVIKKLNTDRERLETELVNIELQLNAVQKEE